MKILVVEDDERISDAVVEYLGELHYAVEAAYDGQSAWDLLEAFPYDLILLDVMLPIMDGLTLCQKLRAKGFETPILMLTARDTIGDKVVGLDAGADDYLVKPFEMPELAVRVEALIRRDKGDVSDTVYKIADLELDTERMVAIRAGKRLTLSPRSFEILRVLMRRAPAVVSRRELEKELWGDEVPDSDALRSHLYNLRRIVDKPFDRPLIETLPGQGFRIVDTD